MIYPLKEKNRYRKKNGNENVHICPNEIVSSNEFVSLV
jgi:hypothetical protein